MLAHQHGPGEVNGQRAIPHGQVGVDHRRVPGLMLAIGDGRRVDQHVDGAMEADHLFDHGDNAGLVGDVDGYRPHLATLLRDAGRHRSGGVGIAVGHDDHCALVGHRLGGGSSDTGRATRDHGDQVLQAAPARHVVARLPLRSQPVRAPPPVTVAVARPRRRAALSWAIRRTSDGERPAPSRKWIGSG